MIKWNENCIEEEDLNPTREMLKKNDYNTDVHRNRSWREDLHHLIVTSKTK